MRPRWEKQQRDGRIHRRQLCRGQHARANKALPLLVDRCQAQHAQDRHRYDAARDHGEPERAKVLIRAKVEHLFLVVKAPIQLREGALSRAGEEP